MGVNKISDDSIQSPRSLENDLNTNNEQDNSDSGKTTKFSENVLVGTGRKVCSFLVGNGRKITLITTVVLAVILGSVLVTLGIIFRNTPFMQGVFSNFWIVVDWTTTTLIPMVSDFLRSPEGTYITISVGVIVAVAFVTHSVTYMFAYGRGKSAPKEVESPKKNLSKSLN